MSENIFSSFYNKVLSFFQKDRLQDGESAKDAATNRLKLVLMQDRSNLDGATMQKMREQLISVISKYVEIDQEALDLNLESDGDEIALMLNIPVIRARTREEIEELEKQEQEALKEQENSEDADENDSKNDNASPDDESENSDNENEELTDEAEEDSSSVENTQNDSENQDDNQETDTEAEEQDDSAESKKSKKSKNK